MPEFTLRQGAAVPFPAGPLTIRATPGLRIDVRPRRPGATVRTASRQPDMVVVPQVSERCDVHLSRVDGASFAGSDPVAVTFSGGERSGDPSVATLAEVHAAGQVEVLAATVEPEGAGLRISVEGTADRPDGMAGLASDAVKRLVLDGARPAGRDVAVALDCSASMRPWAENGAVATVVELLCGIDHAAGSERGVQLEAGDGWRRLDPASALEVVTAWVGRPTARTGSTAAVGAPAGDQVVFLVTDAVPVDYDPDTGQRLVVLCRPGAWEQLDDGRAQAAVPVTVPSHTTLADLLQRDPQALIGLVSQLADPLLTRGDAQ